ncbi:endolytic transglycosylase MltG [Aquibacillus kalidii]|uniref:endolytic transglycosylase MltG n=1 Tax=Aquibacillus kalidii TaxID=2762597 RepID=UPI0016449819|nr:endolytic transglycosylase MltG [Aquibacillus kalidii]
MSTSDNNNKDHKNNGTNKPSKLENIKKSHKELVDRRGEEARIVRKIVSIVLILLTIFIVVGGISGYLYIRSALEPVDSKDDSKIEINIPLGSSTSQIASILEDNGIINNSMIYRFYIKFNNAAEFQAGDYTLSPSMTLGEITEKLQTGTVMKEAVLRVTVPEGKTIEEIAAIYEENANVDKKEFMEKVNDRTYIEQLIQAYPSILSDEILEEGIRAPLEGYLFAATYQFYKENPSVETIVEEMLKKTEEVVTPYLEQINEKDWTVHEALTMASLVENEARSEEDRKIIAGVFYNRLEDNMMLQTDPTVIYALGEDIDRVYNKHLETDSPYNTYQNVGLPIGPISNFAENSITSVLEPEETDYMYFIADDDDGEIYYAKTYDQHEALVAKYLRDRD